MYRIRRTRQRRRRGYCPSLLRFRLSLANPERSLRQTSSRGSSKQPICAQAHRPTSRLRLLSLLRFGRRGRNGRLLTGHACRMSLNESGISWRRCGDQLAMGAAKPFAPGDIRTLRYPGRRLRAEEPLQSLSSPRSDEPRRRPQNCQIAVDSYLLTG
jgi:hypothetical protein